MDRLAATTPRQGALHASWSATRAARHHHRQSVVVAALPPSEARTTTTPPGPTLARRVGAAAATAALATALAALAAAPAPAAAAAAEAAAALPPAPAPTTTVYFGNGCFWGRQKDFVDTEMRTLSRPPERVSAVAGYAGGAGFAAGGATGGGGEQGAGAGARPGAGPGGRVCYHFNDPRQVYERLGHAEVVAVDVDGIDGLTAAAATAEAASGGAGAGAGGGAARPPALPADAEREMRAFSKTYFSQFRRLRDGRLQRLDPQDQGPGYRNVVGLPGGVRSPLFGVLQSEAPPGVELREGKGRGGGGGEGAAVDEGDVVGVVWVVDSARLPFYRAEQYHQYHRGMEGSFPPSYLKGQREVALKAGRIDPTGCLEFPF
jgi:hypothetical protein